MNEQEPTQRSLKTSSILVTDSFHHYYSTYISKTSLSFFLVRKKLPIPVIIYKNFHHTPCWASVIVIISINNVINNNNQRFRSI